MEKTGWDGVGASFIISKSVTSRTTFNLPKFRFNLGLTADIKHKVPIPSVEMGLFRIGHAGRLLTADI